LELAAFAGCLFDFRDLGTHRWGRLRGCVWRRRGRCALSREDDDSGGMLDGTQRRGRIHGGGQVDVLLPTLACELNCECWKAETRPLRVACRLAERG
jgi:hypothetical protein